VGRQRDKTGAGSKLNLPMAPAQVPPPIEPRRPYLPFDDPQFDWPFFQRLCAAIARAEGYTTVEEYGRSGQKQFGLDIYASASGRASCVYQARRIKQVTPRRLSTAVATYVSKGLRLEARRFVLCVASSTLDTRLTDQLVKLQAEYPDLEIALYGRERLSEILRNRPDIVRAFFGDDWARAFCTTPEPAPPLDPEALVRGPLSAMGLGDLVAQAAAQERSDPSHAASLYDAIADRLKPRYPVQASTYHGKAARALARASQWQEAFDRWFALAEDELWNSSRPRLSPSYHAGLKDAVANVDSARRARWRAVEAWLHWHEAPQHAADLAKAFDELYAIGDLFALRAGVLLAESHIVDGDLEPVRSRATELNHLCASLDTPDHVRLRVALADALGLNSWNGLFRRAVTRDLPVRDAAYVALRAGHWYAWAGETDLAEVAYRRALELGSEARLEFDVRNAMYSLAHIYVRSRRDTDADVALDMTRSIEGTGSYVPQNPRTRESSLRALSSGGAGPDAHMWLRHELWEAFVAGDLGGALETLSDLGRLYESTGFPIPALHSYVRSGDEKSAGALAGKLPAWVDLTSLARTGPQWQRRTAFVAIAAEGDLVPEDDARNLVPAIVAMLGSGDNRMAPVGAELAGAIAYQLSLEDATRVTEALMPHAPRGPQQYRWTDPGLLSFAGRTYLTHPKLRARLAALITEVTRAGLVDSDVRQAVSACSGAPKPLVSRLTREANAGNAAAAELLETLGVEHATVIEQGRKRLARVLDLPPASKRTQHQMGGTYAIPHKVFLETPEPRRSAYVAKLLAIAVDSDEMVMNRTAALDGLGYASASLTRKERARCLATILPLTRGTTLSALEERQKETSHPLSRYRINLGSAEDIQAAAIATAVTFADTAQERKDVLAAAVGLLDKADASRALAFTFAVLDERGTQVAPRTLASSPYAPIRQAAVTLWSRNPRADDLGHTFASDPTVAVRSQLARALSSVARADRVLAANLRAALRRDPSVRVRRIARLRRPVTSGSRRKPARPAMRGRRRPPPSRR
jgi:hypothetical protein